MGNFVRGGQVSLHTMRMYRQVFAFMWAAVVFSFLLFPALYIYQRTSNFERYVFVAYYVAKAKVEFGKGHETVRITHDYGRTEEINADVLMHAPNIIGHANYMWDIVIRGVVLTAFGLLGAGILLVVYFILKGKKLGSPGHVRGGNITDAKSLAKTIAKDNKKQKITAYTLAGVPYPAYTESQHTFITGSPGAGKTVAISDLIAQIKARGDRAIIYDKMGNYVKWFYEEGKDVIMNPLDARSVSWSVFNEARSSADFDTMAEAMMPTEKGAVDPFWTNAARVLFSNVCDALYNNGNGNNKTLLRSLLKTDLAQLAKLIKNTPAQAIIDEQSPKTALSVMSVLATNVGAMKFLKDSGEPFSIRKWISDEESSGFLFVTSRADQHASLRPLISTWLDVAINSLLSLEQSRDRKIWIILDELPSLHYLPSLQSGLAESRQFGGAFVLALQVMPQLQSIYGHDMARATSGLCQTRLVFKSSDNDTARIGSESLGRSETEEFREGLSYGAHEMRDGINISTSTNIKNLILPTEIMNLPNLSAYLRFGMDYPVAKVKLSYVERKIIAEKFVPCTEQCVFTDLEEGGNETEEDTNDTTDNSDVDNIAISSGRLLSKKVSEVKQKTFFELGD